MLVALCAVAVLVYHFGFSGNGPHLAPESEATDGSSDTSAKNVSFPSEASVDLTASQLDAIKIEPAGTFRFSFEKDAVGSVAYHEKDIVPDAQADGKISTPLTKFIVANVPESSSTFIHVGQPVRAKLVAYPDRIFEGTVSMLGVTVYDSGGNPAIDPTTHRIAVRCEIADPKNELYPGMLASVAIQVANPVESVAVPVNGVVRKGDGTMTVWVTKDRKHFVERTVTVGLQQNGYDQIVEGLKPDELLATDGAVFISNILYAPPSD